MRRCSNAERARTKLEKLRLPQWTGHGAWRRLVHGTWRRLVHGPGRWLVNGAWRRSVDGSGRWSIDGAGRRHVDGALRRVVHVPVLIWYRRPSLFSGTRLAQLSAEIVAAFQLEAESAGWGAHET